MCRVKYRISTNQCVNVMCSMIWAHLHGVDLAELVVLLHGDVADGVTRLERKFLVREGREHMCYTGGRTIDHMCYTGGRVEESTLGRAVEHMCYTGGREEESM